MSMSAADMARRDAVRALETRLHGWGVATPMVMAQRFIDDLVRQGWVWAPVDRRPHPPKADEACRTCGRRLPCGCDAPTDRPAPAVPPPAALAVIRAQLAQHAANTCSHGVPPKLCAEHKDAATSPQPASEGERDE